MIKNAISQIWESMKQKTSTLEDHLTTFGIFLLIVFPSFYYINILLAQEPAYENMPLRLTISVMGLILVFRKFIPQTLKFLIPLLLYVILFFAFSFFYFFMTFKNDFSSASQVNVFVGLFVLLLFLSWRETIFMGILGFILAWFIVSYFDIPPTISSTFWNVVIAYLTLFIYIILFSTKKESIHKETLRNLKALAGAIAHEVRTPLFGIATEARWLKRILPSVLQSYHGADQLHDLSIKPLTPNQEKLLSSLPDNLEATTREAFTIIDIFLMNLKDISIDKDLEICSISDCIKEALNSYTLTDDERQIITQLNDEDFTFMGNPLLTKHILYNLLKNALYHIKDAQKGAIFIWTERDKNYNRLHFKDTGKGIPKTMLPHIFERFYTKTKYGTGIGLAFCKMVMEGIGGHIRCESVEGEYVEFILLFPIIDSSHNNMIKYP